MPFVQMIKERIEVIGVQQGLQQTCEFPEEEVLKRNEHYITNSLELEGLYIRPTEEAESEMLKEECCPGSPYITFHSEPGIVINVLNIEPGSGYFSTTVTVLANDTVAKVKLRMFRERIVRDPKKVEISAYVQTYLNTRVVPSNVVTEQNRIVTLNNEHVFRIDTNTQTLSVVLANQNNMDYAHYLGDSLIYSVKETRIPNIKKA